MPKEIESFNIKSLPHHKDKEDAEKASQKPEVQPEIQPETPEKKELKEITTKDKTGQGKTFKIGNQVWSFDNEGEINYFTIKKILPAKEELPASFATEIGLEFFLEDFFYNKEDAEKKAEEWLKKQKPETSIQEEKPAESQESESGSEEDKKEEKTHLSTPLEKETEETEKTEEVELSEEEFFKDLSEELKKIEKELKKLEEEIDLKNETEEETQKEEKKIEEVVNKLPEKQRKGILNGISNIGFQLRESTNKVLKNTANSAAKKTSNESLKRFFESASEQYAKKEEEAKKIKEKDDKKFREKASGFFTLVRWGRVLHGYNLSNPIRMALIGSMAAGFLSETTKNARLKNQEVIERVRIDDVERAEEEAYKIQEEAEKIAKKKGKSDLTVNDFKEAYKKNLPKDLLNRISRQEWWSYHQSFADSCVARTVEKLNKKFDFIENDSNLSLEQKEQSKQKFLIKNEQFLNDLDTAINDSGAVDHIVYYSNLVSRGAKIATTALTIETLAEGTCKIWHLFSEFEKSFATGASSGISLEHLTETHGGEKRGLWSSIKNWFSYDKHKSVITPEGGASEKFTRTFGESTKDKILKTYILEGDKNIAEKAYNVEIKHTRDGGLIIKQVSDIDGKTTGVKISKEEIDNYIKRTEDLNPRVAERLIENAKRLAESNQDREDLIKMWILEQALDKKVHGLSFHKYLDQDNHELFKMEITHGVDGEAGYYHMEINGVTQNEILKAKAELDRGDFPETLRKALEMKSQEVNKEIPPELRPKLYGTVRRSPEIGVGPDGETDLSESKRLFEKNSTSGIKQKYIHPSELSPIVPPPAASHSVIENLGSSGKPEIPPPSSPNLETPAPAFTPEEHLNYQGGKSVWKEADLQLKERFKELFIHLGDDNQKTEEALKTFNIDRLKDVITEHPEKYGLPENVKFDKMSAEAIKNINWDKAFHDAFPKNNLTENLSSEKVSNILENNTSEKEKLFSSESSPSGKSKIIPAPEEIKDNIVSESNNNALSDSSSEIPDKTTNGMKVGGYMENQEAPSASTTPDGIKVENYPLASNPMEALREKGVFINDIDKFAKQVGFENSNSADFQKSFTELSDLDVRNPEEAREIFVISRISNLPVETVGKHLDFALNPDLDEKTSSNIIRLLENNRDKTSIRFFNKNYPGRVSSVEFIKLRDYLGREMDNLRVYYTGVVRGGHDAILRINNKEFFIERDGLSVRYPLSSLKNFFKSPDKFIISAKWAIKKAA